jgi:hypothetical protein
MITPHLFITVHAIEGNCVKGGAEGFFFFLTVRFAPKLRVFSP